MSRIPVSRPEGLRQIFLMPGTLYCSSDPAVVRTVLGSCVAVCLMDRHHRAAGMNHYVLPSDRDGKTSLRYGDTSIERLVTRMGQLGCPIGDLRAKVFGGAAVLPFGDLEDTVGSKNVDMALAWLRERAIPIVARRTGGENGLLIRLYTLSGKVMVRPLGDAVAADPAGRWRTHSSRTGWIADDPPLQSVDLHGRGDPPQGLSPR